VLLTCFTANGRRLICREWTRLGSLVVVALELWLGGGACWEEGLSFEVAGSVVPSVSGSQPGGDLAERLSGQKDGGEAGV
jgi:hypothetical protein